MQHRNTETRTGNGFVRSVASPPEVGYFVSAFELPCCMLLVLPIHAWLCA